MAVVTPLEELDAAVREIVLESLTSEYLRERQHRRQSGQDEGRAHVAVAFDVGLLTQREYLALMTWLS